MGSSSSSPCSSSTHGDISKVSTTGASKKTAKQDNLGHLDSVEASKRMAKTDRDPMEKYRSIIYKVAEECEIHPALIAAIISRESRAGEQIKNNGGWGDWCPKRRKWRAFGLMQVDVIPPPEGGGHTPEGAWDSLNHLRQATNILVDFIEKISKKFPDWCREEQLKGGIAAYNIGDGKVKSRNVDEYTTGGDYANDVIARAQWYNDNGFEN